MFDNTMNENTKKDSTTEDMIDYMISHGAKVYPDTEKNKKDAIARFKMYNDHINKEVNKHE